jgi:quaternary ammonium compound-resistance protein SugE
MLDTINPRTAWALIFVSGALEIAFAAAMHSSHGFTRLLPAALAIVSGSLSVYLMSLALAVIPIGTAYAVWAGVGVVGTAAMGIWLLGEPASPMRLLCIALVVVGITGLQLLPST